MSETIGKVVGRVELPDVDSRIYDKQSIKVTSFYGGSTRGPSVQITIDDRYVQLDFNGVRKLYSILNTWLKENLSND